MALFRVDTGDDYFAEIETVDAGRDFLDVMRIIVLPIDDNDVFGTPRYDEFSVNECAAISRSQPVVLGKYLRLLFIVVIKASRDIAAANVNIADNSVFKRLVVIVGDPYLAIANRRADFFLPIA